MRLRSVTTLLLCASLLSHALFALSAPGLSKVSMQLTWHHQFEFAGYYMALEKGFYEAAGLDVSLIEGGPEVSAINEVINGAATFGVSSSGLVKSYIEGKPVLMLAPVFQHSPEVLITKKGLRTPISVVNAGKIALQPGDESLDIKAMFVNEGIALNRLELDHTHGSIDDLIDGKVVGILAYLSNETFLLKERGVPFSILHPDDYGMDFYKGVLFTNSDYAQQHPELVKSFRAATLKGWEYALKHQDEAIGLIMAKYNAQSKSRTHLQYEAEVLHGLINPDIVELGHSNPWRWEKIAETYANLGMIKSDFDLSDFAYEPNPAPADLTWLYRTLAIALVVAVAVSNAIALYIFRTNKRLKLDNATIEQTAVEQHQFINMVSHELKTPIAVISRAMEGMSGEAHLKQRAVQAIEDVYGILQRCEQVDLLEREQIHPQFEPSPLADLINKAILACAAPERIQLQGDEAFMVNTDPQLCQMIFANLLNNAIKYAEPDSKITVHMSQRPDKAEQNVQIEVINQPGKAGLPDEAAVFSKYYRSKQARRQSGTGLGLYLVKQLSALLRASVAYDVTQGNVRFTLWLPS